jgi:hypothetical protein
MGAPEELELDELVPVMVGDPDPPEPDDVGPPELAPLDPLDPKSVGTPLLELDPFAAMPLDPEELSPLEPGLPIVGLPVASEELPHPATEPPSPQRIAKVVRRCIAFTYAVADAPPEGSSSWGLQLYGKCASTLERSDQFLGGLRDLRVTCRAGGCSGARVLTGRERPTVDCYVIADGTEESRVIENFGRRRLRACLEEYSYRAVSLQPVREPFHRLRRHRYPRRSSATARNPTMCLWRARAHRAELPGLQ